MPSAPPTKKVRTEKKSRSNRLNSSANSNKATPCLAEPIEILGETVIIDRRKDIIAANRKEKVAPWIAEWIGTEIVEHGESRAEAVEKITERIQRKQNLRQLQEYFRQRMIRRPQN
jgi:hypothetical protein